MTDPWAEIQAQQKARAAAWIDRYLAGRAGNIDRAALIDAWLNGYATRLDDEIAANPSRR